MWLTQGPASIADARKAAEVFIAKVSVNDNQTLCTKLSKMGYHPINNGQMNPKSEADWSAAGAWIETQASPYVLKNAGVNAMQTYLSGSHDV
jgi:hypothetical protein